MTTGRSCIILYWEWGLELESMCGGHGEGLCRQKK